MADWIPPEFIAPSELIERTGDVLLGDAWTAARTAADAAVAARATLTQQATLARRAAEGQASLARAQAAGAAKRAWETAARVAALRPTVITAIRTALYTGRLKAVTLTSRGATASLPPTFWAGQEAVPAFAGKVVAIGGPWAGRVLIERPGAEVWFAEGCPTTTPPPSRSGLRLVQPREPREPPMSDAELEKWVSEQRARTPNALADTWTHSAPEVKKRVTRVRVLAMWDTLNPKKQPPAD